MDNLLYLFSFPVLDKIFHRGRAEKVARDSYVKLITKYVTKSFYNTDGYSPCTGEKFDQDGFCDYLVFERNGKGVRITTSNFYDMGSVGVLGKLST